MIGLQSVRQCCAISEQETVQSANSTFGTATQSAMYMLLVKLTTEKLAALLTLQIWNATPTIQHSESHIVGIDVHRKPIMLTYCTYGKGIHADRTARTLTLVKINHKLVCILSSRITLAGACSAPASMTTCRRQP